jgi:hypothetical protein
VLLTALMEAATFQALCGGQCIVAGYEGGAYCSSEMFWPMPPNSPWMAIRLSVAGL